MVICTMFKQFSACTFEAPQRGLKKLEVYAALNTL
jgi:hypothetical protein